MKKLFLLLLPAVTLSACKKDSDSTPTSATDLLTSHNWKPLTGTASTTLLGQPASYAVFFNCDKDDAYTFNQDKTLVVDAGSTKCNTSDPQKEPGSWSLSNNDKSITITLTNQYLPFSNLDIKELNANTLHIVGTQVNGGNTYTIDATFVPY